MKISGLKVYQVDLPLARTRLDLFVARDGGLWTVGDLVVDELVSIVPAREPAAVPCPVVAGPAVQVAGDAGV